MKLRIVLASCAIVFALTAMPSRLRADSLCGIPNPFQWGSCGSVAPSNVFTVNADGLANGVRGYFEGFSADFSDSVYAFIIRNGNPVLQSGESMTNHQLTRGDEIPFFTAAQLQTGDQIEFVLHVQNDPNGDDLFYSHRLSLNKDTRNHMWTTSLSSPNCAPGQASPCVYAGFEDLPLGENTDWDYNDFEMWIYGADFTGGANYPTPEPSSMLLLTGAPLAFALGKLRKLF
jgi:hypothetical protein